jgi:hypothetical protein
LFSGPNDTPKETETQGDPGAGIIEAGDAFCGIRDGDSFSGDKVEAAGLVGTNRAVFARAAEIPSIGKPNLGTRKVRPINDALNEPLENGVERLLVGHVQKHLDCEIGVKTRIAGGVHIRNSIAERRPTVHCE